MVRINVAARAERRAGRRRGAASADPGDGTRDDGDRQHIQDLRRIGRGLRGAADAGAGEGVARRVLARAAVSLRGFRGRAEGSPSASGGVSVAAGVASHPRFLESLRPLGGTSRIALLARARALQLQG